jgi:hypothetical protein
MTKNARLVVASLVALLALAAIGFLVWLVFGARPAAAAKRPEAEQAKIDMLLSEIENADATFVRNGSEYEGRKAASHLRTKLFFAGKRVQTARDFVTGVASHSEESGQPYEIRPRGGAARPLADWLLERLRRLEERPTLSATPAR